MASIDQNGNEAERFHKDGYLIIKGLLPTNIIEEVRHSATTNFSRCISYIEEHNLEFGMHAKKGFKEIVQRNENRFEMQFGMDDSPIFQSPLIMENERLHAVLNAIFQGEKGKSEDGAWKLCSRSIVNACPGALEQQWHVDGAHVDVSTHRPCHVLNVFFPLVNLTMENGPTELRPGSQYQSRDLARLTLLAKVKKTLRAPICPLVATGDALLFDYRTLHRGKANVSRESRPVLVLTYSKSWFRDLYNFPKRSIYDSTPSLLPPVPPQVVESSYRLPLVSVVIPTRGNKLSQLEDAVKSVLGQTGSLSSGATRPLEQGQGYLNIFELSDNEFEIKDAAQKDLMDEIFFNIEILVCVDGDEVEAAQSQSPLSDPRVKTVTRLPHSGGRPGLVRNTGIADSRGDWVAFLDDDDIWLPEKIRHQLALMRRARCLMSSTCAVEDHVWKQWAVSGAAELANTPTMPRQFNSFGDVFTSDHVKTHNPIVCSSVLIHRCLIDRTGPWFGESKYGQDLVFWRKCLAVDASSEFSFGSEWYGRSAFLKTCLVVYGTKGERSSTNKETRQAISMIVSDGRDPTTPGSSVTDLIQGFVGV